MYSSRAQSRIKVSLVKDQSCANVRNDAFMTLKKNVSLRGYIWV